MAYVYKKEHILKVEQLLIPQADAKNGRKAFQWRVQHSKLPFIP